ncbi:MAG: alpha/beta fold hydrolase [Bacteroidetes bacterium]|nr:alpha/beta fold hydrolase [Bacteroidota bacterium]
MRFTGLLLFTTVVFISCSKRTSPASTMAAVRLSRHTLAAFPEIKNSRYLVVFEAGLGDNHRVWSKSKIPDAIRPTTDFLTYDRAGYGKSTRGPAPRTIARLSGELDSVITAFAAGRKVILVGHSLGGMIIRDYAVKHPSTVAALLFIDPSHEKFNRPTQQQEDLIALLVGIKSAGSKMEAHELIEDAEYMASVGQLPDVPVTVLTSMKHDEGNTKADQGFNKTRDDWYAAHESLRAGVTDFTHVATTKSGHYIFKEEPDLVIDQLNKLILKLP